VLLQTVTVIHDAVQSPELTPDGRYLLFRTDQDLDQADTYGGFQLYRYDAVSGHLTFVSPGSSVTPPSFDAVFYGDGMLQEQQVLDHNLISDDGRYVFFQTTAPLVPGDRNGVTDVYRWREGEGVSLVSPGTRPSESVLAGASATGESVFFYTRDDLAGTARDGDDAVDLYVARVDGGFPDAAVADVCVGDACQGPLRPPPAPVPGPGSSTLQGLGNAPDAPPASKPSSSEAKVSTNKKLSNGSAFVVSVKVPAAGRIAIAGAGLATAKRTATRAATYRVTIKLTSRAKKTLKAKHKLSLALRVTYTPTAGQAALSRLAVTLREAPSSKRHAPARHASAKRSTSETER
jgi:hypothetical protein